MTDGLTDEDIVLQVQQNKWTLFHHVSKDTQNDENDCDDDAGYKAICPNYDSDVQSALHTAYNAFQQKCEDDRIIDKI